MPRRLVPSGRTGGSAFFDSMLSGQDVQGVLLDGRHPFLCLVNLVFQVIRFFPWAQSAITDTGYIKSDVFYILFDVFEGVKKFYFAPY